MAVIKSILILLVSSIYCNYNSFFFSFTLNFPSVDVFKKTMFRFSISQSYVHRTDKEMLGAIYIIGFLGLAPDQRQFRAITELQCIAELEYGPVWADSKIRMWFSIQFLNCAGAADSISPSSVLFPLAQAVFCGTSLMRSWCFSVSNVPERYRNGSENLAV